MKNNPLDDIVKCSIDISDAKSSEVSYDSILLVIPEPAKKVKKNMDGVTVISSKDELLEYGFTVNDTAYAAASVAFSQNPSPRELYMIARNRLEGENAGYENIKATLTRAKEAAGFYGIHITEFHDTPADVAGAIEWTEENEKLFGFEYTDYQNCPVKNFSFFRSFALFSGNAEGYGDTEDKPVGNNFAALAWMAKCFGYDSGTESWNAKQLETIVPSSLDTEQKKKLKEDHINTFLRYAGSNVTIGGYTLAGEWIDVIRFRDWLKSYMQKLVFSIYKTNRKIPFTDAGIGLIEGKMEEALSYGQTVGGIAPDTYDADDNLIPGYTVTVPRASDITAEEKKSRVLQGCRYTARLAEAIHAVEISGMLTI